MMDNSIMRNTNNDISDEYYTNLYIVKLMQ